MNAVETHNLSRKFGNVTAVDHLNLTIPEGELFALLGINGAGKTTALRMICGLIAPTEGNALLLGKNPQEARQLLNLSPQETAIASNLTVHENLMFIAGIYGMKKNDSIQAAKAMLEKTGLESIAERRAGKLSGGWQRRLSIAMALISNPKILLLDEPTLGLDVLARRELWTLIESLKGKTTIILTTHYLEEAEALADRIGIMVHGTLKALGTADTLKTSSNTSTFEEAFIALATEKESYA